MEFFVSNDLNCISSLNCDLTVSQLVSHSKGFKRSQKLSEPFELDFLISSTEKNIPEKFSGHYDVEFELFKAS